MQGFSDQSKGEFRLRRFNYGRYFPSNLASAFAGAVRHNQGRCGTVLRAFQGFWILNKSYGPGSCRSDAGYMFDTNLRIARDAAAD